MTDYIRLVDGHSVGSGAKIAMIPVRHTGEEATLMTLRGDDVVLFTQSEYNTMLNIAMNQCPTVRYPIQRCSWYTQEVMVYRKGERHHEWKNFKAVPFTREAILKEFGL